MITYELPCLDRCKSFYNKAHVIERDDGSKELIVIQQRLLELMQIIKFIDYGMDIV